MPRAHPRSRGENAPAMTPAARPAGSSPLTRGKLDLTRGRPLDGRLIPAHAGKTRSALGSPRPPQAHPRSRGENASRSARTWSTYGSSPLTRGKQHGVVAHQQVPGLIPAHAGKTRPWRPATRPTRAHPRSRGENVSGAIGQKPPLGSSPLTRGKLVQSGQERGRNVAHPRSRGENSA